MAGTGKTLKVAGTDSVDDVANDKSSTPSELNSALAARLVAMAAAIATYNKVITAADTAQTNADADSWAGYDAAVNRLITVD